MKVLKNKVFLFIISLILLVITINSISLIIRGVSFYFVYYDVDFSPDNKHKIIMYTYPYLLGFNSFGEGGGYLVLRSKTKIINKMHTDKHRMIRNYTYPRGWGIRWSPSRVRVSFVAVWELPSGKLLDDLREK